jgi:hypothetical protein
LGIHKDKAVPKTFGLVGQVRHILMLGQEHACTEERLHEEELAATTTTTTTTTTTRRGQSLFP